MFVCEVIYHRNPKQQERMNPGSQALSRSRQNTYKKFATYDFERK